MAMKNDQVPDGQGIDSPVSPRWRTPLPRAKRRASQLQIEECPAKRSTTQWRFSMHDATKLDKRRAPELSPQRNCEIATLKSHTPGATMHASPPIAGKQEVTNKALSIDAAPQSRNHLECTDYAEHIYNYYLSIEDSVRAAPTYLEKAQTEIDCKMRSALVDWLVEVHLKRKMMPETLYLAVNLLDRYLEKATITKDKLQLVGIVALMIAAKYEEVWPPRVNNFIFLCDGAYTRREILSMENSMVIVLGWWLTVPYTCKFITRFLKMTDCNYDKELALFAAYLAELALVDHEMLKWKSSQIAVTAVFLAMKAADLPDAYSDALRKHSPYMLEDLTDCVAALEKLSRTAAESPTKAVYRKYSSNLFLNVTERTIPQ